MFTVPGNRERDAELIWLLARISDGRATDLIYLLYRWNLRDALWVIGVFIVCVSEKDIKRGGRKHGDRDKFQNALCNLKFNCRAHSV